MKITRKDVEYVAELAHLELSEAELTRLQKELDAILTYVDQLNQVDTTQVEPMAQVLYEARPDVALRPDRLRGSLERSHALAATPDANGTFVRVPKVIER